MTNVCRLSVKNGALFVELISWLSARQNLVLAH